MNRLTPFRTTAFAPVLGILFALLVVLAFRLGLWDLDCMLQPRGCALRDLRRARTFWGAQKSDIGQLESPVLAWRQLSTGPSPAEDFAGLLQDSATVPRLYGLIGLYRFDRVLFQRHIGSMLERQDSVSAMIACRPTHEAVGRLAAEIARGSWTREFEAGSPDADRTRSTCAT